MTTTRYLIIDKKDDVYLKIEADEDIRRELGQFFTFEVPGFKFMPQYRNRVWDGKIRLFSYATGQIYAGLYPYIVDWCNKNDVQIVDGTKIQDVKVNDEDVTRFLKALKIPLEIRDYQREAFVHSITKSRCLLLSPTASGKSLIVYLMLIYNLLRLKEKKQDKILIIVPTTSLVEQLYKDFKDYGYNSDRNVHRIYQGHDKDTNKRVVISTWQSIYNLPKKWFKQFGMVMGDEAHLFKSKSLINIMTKLHHAKYRFGFTGTLDGTQTHKWVLEGLFGPSYKVTRTDELMRQGHLSQLDIQCLVLKHAPQKFDTYEDEIQYLISHEQRNRFIKNLALDLKGNTLVLFQRVESHGSILYEEINNNKGDDRKVFFVHGGVDAEERELVREITERENNAIIVASYGTFSTGINIKKLHNVIFASPSKSRIRNLQSIGRVLRKGKDKVKATLYDISDDCSTKSRRNYTLNHFIERIKTYNEENFNYEIITIQLKV